MLWAGTAAGGVEEKGEVAVVVDDCVPGERSGKHGEKNGEVDQTHDGGLAGWIEMAGRDRWDGQS